MEKTNVKNKITAFWDKHKTKIVVVGGSVVGAVMVGKLLNEAIAYGFKCGTAATLSWCDAQWPELELSRRCKEWMEAHPDGM